VLGPERMVVVIAELSERTQIVRVARSIEDISNFRVASFGSRSNRLTKVAGEYAKSKGKRKKEKGKKVEWEHRVTLQGVRAARGGIHFRTEGNKGSEG
jgi:hypothetical protein